MNTENVSPIPSKGNDIAQIAPHASSSHPHTLQKAQRWLAVHTYDSPWLPLGLRTWFVGYVLAIVLQISVILLIKLLIPMYPAFNFIEAPVLLVVLCISFIWGMGPGILATGIGTLFLILLAYSPYFPLEVRKLEDGVSIILYLVIGLISGSMISQARRMRTDALLVRQKGIEENTQQLQEREQERDHLRAVLAHEQELRLVAEDATRQLQTILEVLPLGVTIADANGRILQRNVAAFQIWGKRPLNPEDLTEYRSDMGTWAETGKPLAASEWPLARALLKGEVSHNTEIDVISFDGEHKTLLYFAAPMRNEQHEITGAVAAGLDITQRKQLELRLRETEQQTRESLRALLVLAEALVSAPITDAMEAADTASTPGEIAQRMALLIRSVLNCKRVSITVFDPRTHEPRSLAVVGLPPELEELWRERRPGFYLSDQMAGNTFAEQFARGNVVVVDMQEPSFAGKPNPYNIQVMLLAPMRIGTQFIGILALDHAEEARGFTDAEKSLAKAVAELAALILERERLLAERAESQANVLALQEANHLKDEFIGIAGHELRTPLTTVKASVQLTRRQVTRLLKLELALSPEATKLIATMQNLLDRAERQIGMQNRLVNDLLDTSRIETGRLELHPELCDLVPFVHEVVEDQQVLTPERHVVFEADVQEEALVLVDADRLRQVITNYLSNALKYSASDQPVFVRIALLETEVRVEVEDRGLGLTEAQQEHIWERFYRVPGVEVKSGSGVGLGLGLHISRMVIERHNGSVGVRSRKGQGSVFWLTLPRAE